MGMDPAIPEGLRTRSFSANVAAERQTGLSKDGQEANMAAATEPAPCQIQR